MSSQEEPVVFDLPESCMEEASPTKNAMLTRKLSVSEATEQAGGGLNAPWYLSWIEVPFHVADIDTGKRLPEACGWAMDSAARGPLIQVGGYIGAAILRLAILDAGGANEKILGLKPSSLLTATSSFVGVIAAIIMPVVGAVVDHTTHRRLMGVLSAVIAVGFVGVQISINAERNNWLFILIVHAIQSFGLLVHTTAVFAYLPDLSLDQGVISHYTSRFNFRQFAAQLVYVSLVIIAGEARGHGNKRDLNSTVQTARDAAGIAFGYGVLFMGYAWSFLFRGRPALSQVPKGQNLLDTGFKQVAKTSRKIIANYRALKWFMISLLLSPEAGTGVVLSIAVTFLTVFMDFTGQDIAITSLILMAGNLMGSLFSKKCCQWINPLNSYRCALTSLAITIAVAVSVMDGPARHDSVYGFASAWGFAMGWVYPSQRVLFCTLIPKGQETEFMGLFVFMGQILGWLLPLVVTILNENNVNMRWGLGTVPFFCIVAVLLTLPMGNYEEATKLAYAASEEKIKSMVTAASHQSKGPFQAESDEQGSDNTPETVIGEPASSNMLEEA